MQVAINMGLDLCLMYAYRYSAGLTTGVSVHGSLNTVKSTLLFTATLHSCILLNAFTLVPSMLGDERGEVAGDGEREL